MKKITGLLSVSAMLFFVLGAYSVPANALAPTDEEALPPPMPSDAEEGLVPLSSMAKEQDQPKAAKPAVHHKKRKHAAKKSKHASRGKLGEHTRISTAQIELTQLGYRPGPADGVMGAKTKAAIKSFQRDHHLKPDGVLGPMTYDALMRESGSKNPMRNSAAPPENFFAAHPDYYGYYGADYANPTSFGSPQTIPNRFGTLQLNAQQTGQNYHYEIDFNGQPVFHADNQPTVINVSRTFNIGNADAVLLTSYATGDNTCPYRHHLLVVRINGNGVHQIENCTRNYEAFTEQGTLFISFPGDSHNGWNAGTVWHYENGALEKL